MSLRGAVDRDDGAYGYPVAVDNDVTKNPKSNTRYAFGCLGLVLVPLAVVAACTAIYATNSDGYDIDNSREAVAQCEARIEKLLKAPSTAEFDSVSEGSGTWTVTGTVDSQNSFGAMIRNDYECTVVMGDETATTTIEYIR